MEIENEQYDDDEYFMRYLKIQLLKESLMHPLITSDKVINKNK